MIYSQHCCTRCRNNFNADMTDLAAPGSHSTTRVVDTAVRLVIEDGLPNCAASWNPRVRSPRLRSLRHDPELGRGRGEKAQRRIPTDYLDWALSDFSGYIAADELYDGPFCVLSIVDNRTFNGCPTTSWTATRPKSTSRHSWPLPPGLEARGLTVQGITTDGSTLNPDRSPQSSVRCRIRSANSTSCTR